MTEIDSSSGDSNRMVSSSASHTQNSVLIASALKTHEATTCGLKNNMTDNDHLQRMKLVELLQQTAMSDRQAFADLYASTSSKLFGVILRIVRNRDDAAEILQEAYLRIWRRAAEYRLEKGAPMSWMITIARNRALDWYRSTRAVATTRYDAEFEDIPDPRENPLEQAIKSKEVQALDVCLDELEAKQRNCIVMAFREGFTHSELSERLNCPLGTIKSWIRRGLASLKECLER